MHLKTLRLCLLVCAPLALAQDDCSDEATPTPAEPLCCQQVDDVLSWHDGAGVQQYQWEELSYTGVYEYVRFEPQAPYCICAVRAQVAARAPGPATVFLWNDFGGDRIDFQVDPPLAALTQQVSPSSNQMLTRFELPEPLVMDPALHLYAGMRWDNPGDPSLTLDAKPEGQGGGQPANLIWLSNLPDSVASVSAAAGDYVVQVEVDWIHEVQVKQFQEVAPEAVGLFAARRLAMGDFDDDGDEDLMTDGPRLFENQGDGTFVEITEAAGLAGLSANGGVWGDVDNDGDLDYFGIAKQDVLLVNQGDGTFVDGTAASGISDAYAGACNDEGLVQSAPTEGAAWLDYNGDGRLDLYQANYECGDPKRDTLDRLWRGRGDGTFEDVSVEAGIMAAQGEGFAGRGVAPYDYDGDGLMDLYVTNYRLDPNLLFHNRGDGTFEEVAQATASQGHPDAYRGEVYYGHSIGAAWGDLNGDLKPDLFVANLAHPRYIEFSDVATLYAQGEAGFEDVTEAGGFIYRETPSNPNLFDYDQDGLLDVFYTSVYEGFASQIYHNDGQMRFSQRNYATGVEVDDGWGSVTADIDNDGDLDLLSRAVFFNEHPTGGWLQVRATGLGDGFTNTAGIGATAVVTLPDGRRLAREVSGGHGTTSQSSLWMHFGIDTARAVDLEVIFPASGRRFTFEDVQVNQRVRVNEAGIFKGGY